MSLLLSLLVFIALSAGVIFIEVIIGFSIGYLLARMIEFLLGWS